MKASKRFLGSLMAGVLCVTALAGCGGSTGSTGSSTGSSSGSASKTASSDEDSYNISFVVKLTDSHFNRIIAGANAYCEEHPNVTVNVQSPTSATDYDGQINMIETTLNSGAYDAMIVSPLQSESTKGLVANAEIPIVACDTDFDSDKKVTFVGIGNEDAAKTAGEAAVEAAKENGVDKPRAVIFTGAQGDETHEGRLRGYKEAIEEAGGEVLEVQYCDALGDKAANAMEAVVQKHPDGIDILLCTNDDMALGAINVIKECNNDAYTDCVTVGFDATQPAVESIKDGMLTMSCSQNSYNMGYLSVDAAVKALQGEELDDFIDSQVEMVDASNVDDFIDSLKDMGVWE